MQQKKKSKAWVAAFIAAGVAVLIYSFIFKLHQWQHYLLATGIALLAGRVIFIMAQGLDTSKEAPAQKKIPKTGNEIIDSMVEKGQETLLRIRRENELIPDEQLSRQMDQVCDIGERIFHTVAEQPAKAPQIRRFMDYYLPTTLKMLEGYRKMDERGVDGEHADSTRWQIRCAMDVVVKAFEKQLDTLYQEDILDISTDIDVLEAMLRQDGLIDSGLHNKE